jgi:hypothetical protein
VDWLEQEDPPLLRRYMEKRDVGGRLKTYWGIDQSDVGTLSNIALAEFDGAIDLVIDDASHQFGPTQASFTCLFPRLRPGGLYVIEDWNWEINPDRLPGARGLIDFARQLVGDVAASQYSWLHIAPGVLAVERG